MKCLEKLTRFISQVAAEEKRGVRFSGRGDNISVAVAKAESYYGSKPGWNLRPFCVAIFRLSVR